VETEGDRRVGMGLVDGGTRLHFEGWIWIEIGGVVVVRCGFVEAWWMSGFGLGLGLSSACGVGVVCEYESTWDLRV
jgi:hypothetical protein